MFNLISCGRDHQPENYTSCTNIDLDRFLCEYNSEQFQTQTFKKVIITKKTLNAKNISNNNNDSDHNSENVSKTLLLQHRETSENSEVLSKMINPNILFAKSPNDSLTLTVMKNSETNLQGKVLYIISKYIYIHTYTYIYIYM